MKIARRKRAQAGNWVFNPGDAKSASRTRLNSFQRAIFGRAQLLLRPPRPQKTPAQKAARNLWPRIACPTEFLSARICARSRMVGLDLGATAGGIIAFLSLLKVRATFALELNLEQKLILYISQIDIRVKTCYTITDEKNSGDYLISRNVRWRVRQFDDVEGAKRRPC